MDITITITIDESEQRAIEAQLIRSGSGETIPELVERITRKNIRGWAEENRQQFVERNRSAVETLVQNLATDPDRDTKLASLGVRFVDGVLQPVAEGSPA